MKPNSLTIWLFTRSAPSRKLPRDTARLGRRQARTQGGCVPGGTGPTEDAAWRRSEAAVLRGMFREGALGLRLDLEPHPAARAVRDHQKQRQQDEVRDDGAAPVADERQGDAGERDHPRNTADDHEGL